MSRIGVVAAMNPKRGMVAIETADDGYTIVELLSDSRMEIGDQFVWKNGHGLGTQTYSNVAKGISLEVCVQNHGVSKANVRPQLLF